MTCYICSVCMKRWGTFEENDEVEITRCEKHKGTLTSAEVKSIGYSSGNYKDKLRRDEKRKLNGLRED